jgi:hypothetical protein
MREFYAIDGYPFEEGEAREALLRLIVDDSLGRVWLITLGDEPIGYLVLALGYSLEYRGCCEPCTSRSSAAMWPGRRSIAGRVLLTTIAC